MTQTSPRYSRVNHPCVCSPLTPPPPQSFICTHHHMLSLRGPNLDEANGRNLDKCTDETNNYLLPEGSFFGRGGGVRRQSLLVDSDRSGRMGLYVSLSFSQRLSLQEPLDLLSCKCAMWAALRQIPCICLTVTLSLRFVGTFGGYCEFNTLKVHTIHSGYVGQHSCTFILNRISVS